MATLATLSGEKRTFADTPATAAFVLFDKTGTLTREKPEVGRILCCGNHTPEQLLSLAAAAEQKFTHPIARAILEVFQLNRPLPQVNMSKYHVGFGITVEIEGEVISKRC